MFLLSAVCACTVAVTLDSLTASDRECSFSLSIVRYEIERKSERGRGTVDGAELQLETELRTTNLEPCLERLNENVLIDER